MFALSWLSLATAAVALLLGLSRNGLTLIYISIGASVVAMVLLLVAVIRRPSGRDAARPSSGTTSDQR